MDDRLDINMQAIRVSDAQSSENEGVSISNNVQNTYGTEPEKAFKSRFKGWLRLVAAIVVFVFLPEQISWAMNYNPAVLWSAQPISMTGMPIASQAPALELQLPQREAAEMLATNVQSLLSRAAMEGNRNLDIQIASPNQKEFRDIDGLRISAKTSLSPEKIQEVAQWLRKPGIHPLNCGVFALHDFLKLSKMPISLEQAALSTLSVDLLTDIVKPGDPTLKTSLYAIDKVISLYQLDHAVIKLEPQDILKLNVPFIANFGQEHFVTVTAIDDKGVHVQDTGVERIMSQEDFLKDLSGYVLILKKNIPISVSYQNVDDVEKAFVWGDRWVDQSDELPGLLGDVGEAWARAGTDVAITVVISIVTWGFGTWLNSLAEAGKIAGMLAKLASELAKMGTIIAGIAAIGIGELVNTINQIAIMNGWWDEDVGFVMGIVLSTALSVGCGMLTSGFAGALDSSVKAGTNGLTGAALGGAAFRGLGTGIGNVPVVFAQRMAQSLIVAFPKAYLARELDKIIDIDDPILKQAAVGFLSSLGTQIGLMGLSFSLDQVGLDSVNSFLDLKAPESLGEFLKEAGLSIGRGLVGNAASIGLRYLFLEIDDETFAADTLVSQAIGQVGQTFGNLLFDIVSSGSLPQILRGDVKKGNFVGDDEVVSAGLFARDSNGDLQEAYKDDKNNYYILGENDQKQLVGIDKIVTRGIGDSGVVERPGDQLESFRGITIDGSNYAIRKRDGQLVDANDQRSRYFILDKQGRPAFLNVDSDGKVTIPTESFAQLKAKGLDPEGNYSLKEDALEGGLPQLHLMQRTNPSCSFYWLL
ncbi:MAG TPA: cysteine peptidase family C39 domain-containing protein, partial [Candidatus Omnitrophota bacterium]|nr:cysteine peptidase family C39 domain-containing protein [Candidatus Omnitrophota bacterium]